MTRDEVTGSKYYNAEDLRKGDATLVIEEVTREEFKADDGYKQKKLVVSFRGQEKRLTCGKMRSDALFDMLGDDTDMWIGQRVRLTLGKTMFAGKKVDCVDVKEPLARPAQGGKPQAQGRPNQSLAGSIASEDDEEDLPPF